MAYAITRAPSLPIPHKSPKMLYPAKTFSLYKPIGAQLGGYLAF
jgi:hypothetical protein